MIKLHKKIKITSIFIFAVILITITIYKSTFIYNYFLFSSLIYSQKDIVITVQKENMNGIATNTKIFTDKQSVKNILNTIKYFDTRKLRIHAAGATPISVKISINNNELFYCFYPRDYAIKLNGEEVTNWYTIKKGTYDALWELIN